MNGRKQKTETENETEKRQITWKRCSVKKKQMNWRDFFVYVDLFNTVLEIW